MNIDFTSDFWHEIKNTDYPIVLYGTGNGADRLLYELDKRNIKVRGCFASDGFVRSRTFHGFKVLSYKEARESFGKMTIVMGFGTHDKSVIEWVKKIKEENDFYLPDLLSDDEGNLFDLNYYQKNKDRLDFVYSILNDDLSKESFESVIKYKLSGRIDYLLNGQVEEKESWKLLNIGDSESFVDCGAYNGDTILRFLSFTDKWSAIYGFEPDVKSFKKLERNTKRVDRLYLYNSFVSDYVGTTLFNSGHGRGSSEGSGSTIQCTTIDSVLNGNEATIIKFDTEGFEREALDGAKATIVKYKPRMVLSGYHKIDDLWVLPQKVLALNKDYSIYFRKAPCIPAWDADFIVI